MSWNNEITENIKKLAGTAHLKDKPDLYYATVNTDNPYNIAARTCNITLISGKSDLNITSASLMPGVNDGILVLPSAGSAVVIAKVANGDPFVFMFSQIDQVFYVAGNSTVLIDKTNGIALNAASPGITLNAANADSDNAAIALNASSGIISLNGTSYSGLVQIQKLIDNLNAIHDYIFNILQPAIVTGITDVGTGSAADGPTGAGKFTDAITGQDIVFEDMENTTVQHGDGT